MNSVARESISEIVIKKSRFICYLQYVTTEEDAKNYILAIKKAHPTAAHHCSAYRVGTIDRISDDGEPSGTAGMPMLNVLIHNQITNTVAVVVRYFGGIKLGAGGLVRAYTDSVVVALDEAPVNKLVPGVKLVITCAYTDTQKIPHIFQQNKIEDYQVAYETKVTYQLYLQQILVENLTAEIHSYNHLIKIEEVEYLDIVLNED